MPKKNALDIVKQTLPPPPPPKPEPVTHVALLVDTSGSMEHCMAKAREMATKQYDTLVREAVVKGQPFHLDLWAFGNVPQLVVESPPGAVSGYEVCDRIRDMRAGGGTPMLGCIDQACQRISRRLNHTNGDAAMIIVVTDGEATDRHYTNETRVRGWLANQSLGPWSFAVVGPAGVIQACASLGFPAGNILCWDGSSEDLERVSNHMARATSTYMGARSRGLTKSTDYFTSDLSAVNAATLAACQRVPATAHEVKKEEQIKPFVERVTRRDYRIGTAYYQLTKPELIQDGKDVIIREKSVPGVFYGGPAARSILGLRPGASAKVKPGNHANYDVFIKSESVNRKLVRGTTLLVVS